MTQAILVLIDCMAVVLLVPCCVVFIETISAAGTGSGRKPVKSSRVGVAVLVPAHNERLQIAATIRTLLPQLLPGDRLLVVADNCTDDTAAIARDAGAEVIAREDAERRGKGYALDWGVRHLAAAPPAVLMVIDADCEVTSGTVDMLARDCASTNRPVQARYLMAAPPGSGFGSRFAEFAWLIKNYVRPLGLYRLGLPCQLMGTGMAFPWNQIQASSLASGNLVEDMKLGADLACSGAPPLFCPDALVRSTFPTSQRGIRGQRRRWEQGHLHTIVTEVPRAFAAGIAAGDSRLIAFSLDLAVPPLALLAILCIAIFTAGGVFALFGRSTAALYLPGCATALLFASVLIAWIRYGRRVISARELLLAPFYVLGKIPLYARLLISRQIEWVRTRRDGE